MINLENTELREALENRICANKDIATHPKVLSEIEGHTIDIEMETSNLEDDEDFNCVMYAFNVRLVNPTSPTGRYYIGTLCLKRLIDSGHLKLLNTNQPPEKTYAIYFNNDKVSHIGVVSSNGYILSKWGMGNLYKHLPEQVPLSYGDTVKFYEAIDNDVAMDFFKGNCR